MLRKQHATVVALFGLVACQVEVDDSDLRPRPNGHLESVRVDRSAALQTVWNQSPADVPGASYFMAPTTTQSLSGAGLDTTLTKRSLVLYDQSGPWGGLGELYAIGAVNFASHFGSWTAKPATAYNCGELASYDAIIYIGSSYDEPLPVCLLDNVLSTSKPVLWSFYNIWQVTSRAGYDAFTSRYGWYWTGFDVSPFIDVAYKGHTLARYAANGGGLLGTTIYDTTKASVIATAHRADGSELPWAIRAGNLTYIAEIPFTYMTEEDRYLVFADLLFDALAPSTPERHRAVLRIEDISPESDPIELRAVADYLFAQGIPFGFGVIAEYLDPLGYYNDGMSERIRLDRAPEVVLALDYMRQRGGVMLMHGYTHQWSNEPNPYTAVTGDDTEFYRITENEDHTLNYVGPLPGDTVKWTRDRIDNAKRNFVRAGMTPPAIFEFPHYAGSVNAYRASASRFGTRWERALYFPHTLSGGAPSYQWMFGQMFPYVVRDVYGMRVLPENLGNIALEPFYIFPTRFPAQIINAAEKNLVVRDGTVGFYFHPYYEPRYLEETVEGLRALGYTFVSPNAL